MSEVANVYALSNIMRNIFKFNSAKITPENGQSSIGEVYVYSSSSITKLFEASGFIDIKIIPVYRKKPTYKNIKENIRIILNNSIGYIIKGFAPTLLVVAKVD